MDRAKEFADRLASIADPAYLDTRGWVRFKRGEFHEAVPLLKQASDGSPQSPLLRYHLGMARLRAGDREGALSNLRAAVSSGAKFYGVDEARGALENLKSAG